MIFWYAGGRRYYTGPLIEAEVQSMDATGARDSGSDSHEKMKI